MKPNNVNIPSATTEKEHRIRMAVGKELRHHPKATLIDLYKYFFQGAFGPGHIIRDKSMALQQLQNELRIASEFDPVLWQPVGYNEQFYRVNIRLVKDGTIPLDALFDAFIGSVSESSRPSTDEWIEEWNFIEAIIVRMDILDTTDTSNKDYATVLDNLLTCRPIKLVHHSEIYHRLYHPHYRLISSNEFSQLNLQTRLSDAAIIDHDLVVPR